MNRKIFQLALFGLLVIGAFWLGAAKGKAALNFGSGAYINLCGTGVAATAYTCDPACNPEKGTCTSNNNAAVRWTCTGKWNECVELESDWTNEVKIGGASCGTTVQIASFDKKCRKQDGTWDDTCQLKGYMVWYSGDCWGATTPIPSRTVTPPSERKATPTVTPVSRVGSVNAQTPPTATATPRPTNTPTPTITPKPTATPTPTLKPTATPKPSATPGITATPTVSPTPAFDPKLCSEVCEDDAKCGTGLKCVGGICRNPDCTGSATCNCTAIGGEAVADNTPDTGYGTWIGMILMAGLGYAGWRIRKVSARVW